MTVVFDGGIWLHYGFIDVMTPNAPHELAAFSGGQVNGLCGAAVPGRLHMITGLHTGLVRFTMECFETEPPLGDEWGNVVEASFTSDSETVSLSAFQDFYEVRLPGPGDYRVRYCGLAMDAGAEMDTPEEHESAPDRYLLQLWPAPPAPDAVIRETAYAAYWHGHARNTPPPPPLPTRAEREAARREEDRRRAEAGREQMQALLRRHLWGGREPTAPMETVGGRTAQLAREDWALAEALAAAAPATQRAAALWCARDALARLRPGEIPGAAAALDAVESGRPVPAPFDDLTAVWQSAFPGPRQAVVRRAEPGTLTPVLDPRATVLDAVVQALLPEPGQAAVGAADALLRGRPDRDEVTARLRAAVGLAGPAG